jgi:hypothetical protein
MLLLQEDPFLSLLSRGAAGPVYEDELIQQHCDYHALPLARALFTLTRPFVPCTVIHSAFDHGLTLLDDLRYTLPRAMQSE